MTRPRTVNIHVLTSGAFSGALARLAPVFEAISGHTVTTTLAASTGDSSNTIPARLARGEAADVVIMVAVELHHLQTRGLIAHDTIIDLAKTSLAVGVRRGAPQPDVSSADAVADVLAGADTIVVSESASGIYVRTELLTTLGIKDQVWQQVRTVTDQLPGSVVARGQAQIVIEQLSELLAVSGVEVAGLLPENLQQHVIVGAALGRGHGPPRVGRDLITFLAAPPQRDALRAAGLTPAARYPPKPR